MKTNGNRRLVLDQPNGFLTQVYSTLIFLKKVKMAYTVERVKIFLWYASGL